MEKKEGLTVSMISLCLTLLFLNIVTIKSQCAPGNTNLGCKPSAIEIKCGQKITRPANNIGDVEYFNFTINQGYRVYIVMNSSLGSDYDLSVRGDRYCPTYDLAYCAAPPSCYCQPCAGPGTESCVRILTAGTYYFLVYNIDGYDPYTVNVTCQLVAPAGVFCCDDKCYNSGICCQMGTSEEYWSSTGCYRFKTWVKPEKMMFTLGSKTQITLYIENMGSYTDIYDVTYKIDSSNPELIKVDLTGASTTGNMAHGEIKKLHPRITVLSTDANGDVNFNVTSRGDPSLSQIATLHIIQSDYPVSLPEFSLLGLIEILVLVVIIYSLILIKKY